MGHTIIYILVVTDLTGGCQSPPSQVIVAVEGGVLSVNPVAQPDAVCLGDTARLFALSGGGSGMYTYNWSSVPAGFTSTLANPSVVPAETTTYKIKVNDGFNQLEGTTNVTIYPLPYIHLGPADSIACIYDTVRLDAGNPGSVYKWSTGSVSRYLTCSTTGIGYDLQTYSVIVTNQNNCSNTAAINITFSFDGCVGIEENAGNKDFAVFPNPAHGSFRLHMYNRFTWLNIEILNLTGSVIQKDRIPKSGQPGMEKEFDISALTPGIYILHVRSESFARSVKLVVQ
jgi:hypothetical protein